MGKRSPESFMKRQREMDKKRKAQEKRMRRQERRNRPDGQDSVPVIDRRDIDGGPGIEVREEPRDARDDDADERQG